MIKILILLAVLTGGTIQCNFAQSYRSSNIPKAEILHSCRVDVLDERGVRKGSTNLSRGDIFAIEKDFGSYVLIFIEGGFASVNKSDIRIDCESDYSSYESIERLPKKTSRYSAMERAVQSALSENPATYAPALEELNKKYPNTPTRSITPAWIQDEIDDADLDRKARKLEIQKGEAELLLKVMQASHGNRAYSDQLALALNEILGLGFRDGSFMIKREEIKKRYPQAFNDNAFIEIIDKPLCEHYQSLQSGH